MSFSRAMLCIFLPPLAVRGKGREAVLVVTALTLFCWLPGVLAAVFMCWREAADPAERRAMALYPELAIEGSPLNREFIRRYKRYLRLGTRNLSDPDWAVKLARECKEDIDEATATDEDL
jgi:uncharacterized membrane protein YqaE (UPF0057 family)